MRQEIIAIKLSEENKALIEKSAKTLDLPTATFVRTIILEKVKSMEAQTA